MSTHGAVSWLRIMIMCQSEATCLPGGAVSWLRIMIMCQSEATCLPTSSELAQNHDNVSE